MTGEPLSAERILVTAEDVLRRHGLAKANVVDVARGLGVSHGSVYRHFASKADLLAAVTRRWLDRVHAAPTATGRTLMAIAADDGPAAQRLREWLAALLEARRRTALDDPELFAAYIALANETSEVIAPHTQDLLGQLERIIGSGVRRGEMTVDDVGTVARAVFDATMAFHTPLYAARWEDPATDAHLEAVTVLLLNGLGAGLSSLAPR